MTNEEIDKMEAGPEMDALVAEKVMGWKLGKPRWVYTEELYGRVKSQAWEGSTKDGMTQTIESWRPSTEITAAWLVVEKIGGVFRLEKYPHPDSFQGYPGICWVADFHIASSLAETAPLTICRAALKAVNKR